MLCSKVSCHCSTCPVFHKSVLDPLKTEDNIIDEINRSKVHNHYKKGQTVYLQGNPVWGLYCIKEGSVKVSQSNEQGKEIILHLAHPGESLAHSELFSNTPHLGTAVALKDSVICFIERACIEKMIELKPALTKKLLSVLSSEVRDAEKKITSMAQKNVRERMAELLIELKQEVGELDGDLWKLNIELTRYEMASMIGVANETCVRLLTELKDEKIINLQGKNIIIKNMSGLEQFAGYTSTTQSSPNNRNLYA